MQKNKKIGFMVDDTSNSQLSFNLIKNANEFLENNSDDIVVFFENSTSSVLNPNFSIMSINEIWNFNGSLIATIVSTSISMRKCFAPQKKFFYVWDLEWTRPHGKDFEYIVQAYTDPETTLIARSKEHAAAIENYCNRKVKHVVEDFNMEELARITNE